MIDIAANIDIHKNSGYDGILFEGKSDTPVYLCIQAGDQADFFGDHSVFVSAQPPFQDRTGQYGPVRYATLGNLLHHLVFGEHRRQPG